MEYHEEKPIGFDKEQGVHPAGSDDSSLHEVDPTIEYEEPNNLKRSLKNRHIAMISYVSFIALATRQCLIDILFRIGGMNAVSK